MGRGTTITARTNNRTLSTIRVARPKFDDVWQHYPVNMPAPDVYALVGGNVLEHYQEDPVGYANACALRLSRSFNYGGLRIQRGNLDKGYRLKGGDGLPYIMRVEHMIDFVKTKFGNPDDSQDANGVDLTSYFSGKKGVLIFQVSGWDNATGHVTLWNGSKCGDSCYFVNTNNEVTTKILFWELK